MVEITVVKPRLCRAGQRQYRSLRSRDFESCCPLDEDMLYREISKLKAQTDAAALCLWHHPPAMDSPPRHFRSFWCDPGH